MIAPQFDYEAFNRRYGKLLARSPRLSYPRVVESLRHIRREYKTANSAAKRYRESCLAKTRLLLAIDTDQRFRVVDKCFRKFVQHAFGTFWSEVFTTISYADYCEHSARVPSGLAALHRVRKRLLVSRKVTGRERQHLLQELANAVERLMVAAAKAGASRTRV